MALRLRPPWRRDAGAGGMDEGLRGERRARVLEAAGRVFSRQGYDRASMDEIALEAGMGKPTLYRYFPGKESLFAAVFVEALDALEARLETVLARERTLERRLFGLVRAMIPTFRDHLVPLRLLGDKAAAVDLSRRRIFRERRARIAGFLARAVEEAADRGEARPVEPDRVAHLTIGMIWGGAAAIRAGDDEIAREIAGLILHGIGEAAAAPPARLPAPILAGSPERPHPAAPASRHQGGPGAVRPREATSA